MNWLDRRDVEAFHAGQIGEFGGLAGLRDAAALESAVARPRNLATHGKPSVCELASACAFGICRNHPFVDGNKRTSFVAAAVFLELNGREVVADEAEVVETILALASGRLGEAELGRWLEANSLPNAPRRRR